MKTETTLKTIKSFDPSVFAPCGEGWKKLLKGLGQDLKNPDLDREVSLRFIFKNNGLADALWALRCFPELNTAIKWYALWCAENVRHLMNDDISTYVNKVLDANRQYLLGHATKDELSEAISAGNEACESGAGDGLIGEDGLITSAWFLMYAAHESVFAAWASDAERAAERASDTATWSALASVSTAAERQAQEKEFERMLDRIEFERYEYKVDKEFKSNVFCL